MTIKWKKWNDTVIKKQHGDIRMYRKLYDGDHADLFSRAKRLIDEGEITDQIIEGQKVAKQVATPYLVANVCKMIVDIPSMLVSRAVGNVATSKSLEDFTDTVIQDDEEEFVDPLEKQKAMIKSIQDNSNLSFEHKANIIHHQMDGGIVGVPYDTENGLKIEFKSRDVYFPHSDGQGCDLAYHITIDVEDLEGWDGSEEGEKEFLHIYRERVEGNSLYTHHILYEVDETGEVKEIEEEADIMDILGVDSVERIYEGRSRPFVVYWANDKTFTRPLGRSALHNQANKQDEVNWTLTRNSIVYERNGKPRVAVSKEIMRALQDKAFERFGDESKIDHRDLEIVTFDQSGKAMEVIQIDITKIGDIKWVKDVMKIMLMETHTSEKAIDFYLDGGNAAQSGIAKFYDLFTSITKSEQIMEEYINFIQQLFENCLWIANQDDPGIVIEQPKVQIKSMMPIARKELIDQETTANKNGTQSRETTVRNQNPTASEEWIEDELNRLDEEQESADSASIIQGRQSLSNLLDNRNPNGTPTGGDQ